MATFARVIYRCKLSEMSKNDVRLIPQSFLTDPDGNRISKADAISYTRKPGTDSAINRGYAYGLRTVILTPDTQSRKAVKRYYNRLTALDRHTFPKVVHVIGIMN